MIWLIDFTCGACPYQHRTTHTRGEPWDYYVCPNCKTPIMAFRLIGVLGEAA